MKGGQRFHVREGCCGRQQQGLGEEKEVKPGFVSVPCEVHVEETYVAATERFSEDVRIEETTDERRLTDDLMGVRLRELPDRRVHLVLAHTAARGREGGKRDKSEDVSRGLGAQVVSRRWVG